MIKYKNRKPINKESNSGLYFKVLGLKENQRLRVYYFERGIKKVLILECIKNEVKK